MTPRANFASEFLLRELLSSLGTPLTTIIKPSDSFSESLSEDTESQVAVKSVPSRVMLVRRTNSLLQTVTLVDREYDIEAFIPRHVIDTLQQECGYKTIGRLRGSVVRVTKYHFATMTRLLFTDQPNRKTSVSVPTIRNQKIRVYLCVDALAIVEDNELAIQPHLEVYSHPLVEKRLNTLNEAELEKQLMINQGLSLLPAHASDRFDDDRPLCEEDCVIPADQEQKLEEQEAWGPQIAGERRPTDSELIEENGAVPLSESQIRIGRADKAQSTHDSITSSEDLSVAFSGNSLSGDIEDQRFQFQQENIQETFVAGSGTDSSDGEDDDIKEEKMMPGTPRLASVARSSSKDALVHSSEAAMQSLQAVVDLTADFSIYQDSKLSFATLKPEDQNQAQKASKSYTVRDQEQDRVTLTDGAKEGEKDDEGSLVSSPTIHQPARKRALLTSWGFLKTLASRFSTETLQAKFSDKKGGNSAGSDQELMQILDQEEKEEVRADMADKPAEEEYTSSQATMVLYYPIDNDEDAFAFDYEGMESPKSLMNEHNEVRSSETFGLVTETERVNDMTLTEEKAKVASIVQQADATKESAGSQNLSTAAQSATADVKTEIASPQLPPIVQLPASPNTSAHGNNNLKTRVFPADLSETSNPIMTPPKIIISVGCNVHQARQIGFSSAESHGLKRDHHDIGVKHVPASTTAIQASAAIQANAFSDGQSRDQELKRRRRDMLSTQIARVTGSQSPQFKRPGASTFTQKRRILDRSTTTITNVYSLNAVCRSLGSDVRRETVKEKQKRSTRQQSRRVWKRYENLFPPLNTTQSR